MLGKICQTSDANQISVFLVTNGRHSSMLAGCLGPYPSAFDGVSTLRTSQQTCVIFLYDVVFEVVQRSVSECRNSYPQRVWTRPS